MTQETVMAENEKTEKLKGSETDSETAARQRKRHIQQGAQGAGMEGPIRDTPPRDEDPHPDHKTSRG